ncbi:MAG: M48 family metalloprotease, partial [Tepidimonas sp.]
MCAALAPAARPAHAAELPALGDGGDLTLAEERRLGDQIARAIYRDPAYLDDPVLDGYLAQIWTPLFTAARQRGELPDALAERFAWRLLLARDRTVNAFALPGGYLGVHLGLIGVSGNADELASVLAHELCHVTQRHIARLL